MFNGEPRMTWNQYIHFFCVFRAIFPNFLRIFHHIPIYIQKNQRHSFGATKTKLINESTRFIWGQRVYCVKRLSHLIESDLDVFSSIFWRKNCAPIEKKRWIIMNISLRCSCDFLSSFKFFSSFGEMIMRGNDIQPSELSFLLK